MTVTELIELLQKHLKTHPDIQVVQALNREGNKTNSIGIHLLKKTLLIKGELT